MTDEPLWDALTQPAQLKAACAALMACTDAARLRALVEGCAFAKDGRLVPGARIKALPAGHREQVALSAMRALGALDAIEVLRLTPSKTLDSLDVIAGLPALKRLDLWGLDALTELSALRTLPSLVAVEISICDELRSLEDLRGLPRLAAVSVDECYQLADLSALREMPGLRKLCVSEDEDKTTGIDLGPVFLLEQLHELELFTPQDLDLGRLAPLRSLRKLEIGACGQRFPPIRLPALEELEIDDLGDEDFAGLSGLPALRRLHLTFCQSLASLAGIEALPRLESLHLHECDELRDWAALSGTGLRELALVQCGSELLEAPVSLPALRKLQLSMLFEVELKALDAPALEHLVIGYTRLRDLSPLRRLSGLRRVELRGLRSADLRPLIGMPSLEVSGDDNAMALWAAQQQEVALLAGQTDAQREVASRIRQLLATDEAACIEQGLELLRTLEDPTLLAILSSGTMLDAGGVPHPGEAIQEAVPERFRTYVALSLLGMQGRLGAVPKLSFSSVPYLPDLSVLDGMDALKEVTFRGNDLSVDLTPLQQRPALTDLTLVGADRVDLRPLGALSGLRRLVLSHGQQVPSPDVFRGLAALERLDLSSTPIETLAGISEIPGLEWLTLSNCAKLHDLSGLERLRKLVWLNLWGCERISDLSGIRHLSALRYLSVARNAALRDLSFLAGLPKLATVVLQRNPALEVLGPLRTLPLLDNLNLSGCERLSDLSPLRGLRRLRHLYLDRLPQLRDLSGLEGCTRIYRIELFGTEADLSTLPVLPGLERLKLLGRQAAPDLTQLTRQPRLRCVEIDHPDITDLSPLAGMSRLQVTGSDRIEALWAQTVNR